MLCFCVVLLAEEKENMQKGKTQDDCKRRREKRHKLARECDRCDVRVNSTPLLISV